MRLWKKFTAIGAGIVLFASVVAAYDIIRPYPTRAEFSDIAGLSIETALRIAYDRLAGVQDRLAACRTAKGNCTNLIEQELQRLFDIEKLERRLIKQEAGG